MPATGGRHAVPVISAQMQCSSQQPEGAGMSQHSPPCCHTVQPTTRMSSHRLPILGAAASPSTAPSDTILAAHAMPWSRKAALKGAFTSMFW